MKCKFQELLVVWPKWNKGHGGKAAKEESAEVGGARPGRKLLLPRQCLGVFVLQSGAVRLVKSILCVSGTMSYPNIWHGLQVPIFEAVILIFMLNSSLGALQGSCKTQRKRELA